MVSLCCLFWYTILYVYLYIFPHCNTEDDVGTPVHCNKNFPLGEIFKTYAESKGIDESSFRFCIGDKEIQHNDTPNSLQLEDNCLIIAKRVILVKVKDETGEETTYRINMFGMMSGVFKDYASRKGVEESSLHYSINGNRILPTDTPDLLQLDNDAVIYVTSDNTVSSSEAFSSTPSPEQHRAQEDKTNDHIKVIIELHGEYAIEHRINMLTYYVFINVLYLYHF
jgi:hypothetical protein